MQGGTVLLVCLVILLSACGGKDIPPPADAGRAEVASEARSCAPRPGERLPRSALIAHAGGAYRGLTYTNSLEAMNHSYSQGFRLIEIDLIRTSDGALVSAHDWPRWHERTGSPRDSKPPTREEFFSFAGPGDTTLLDYEGIQAWLQDRPDAVLVTDKVRDFKYLVKHTPDQAQLMVEVFGMAQYEAAVNSGIETPMLAIRSRPDPEEDLAILDFVARNQVEYATMYMPTLDRRSELVNGLVAEGVCIYAYTTNSAAQIEHYRSRGVYGFYTDTYVPDYW